MTTNIVPLRPAASSPGIVPSPSNPMGVARQLVDELYTHADQRLVLRALRGDFYAWDGTCWPEAEARGIRGAIYRWLEYAAYADDKGAIKPYEPNRRKVEDVLDALRAVAHLDGRTDPPAWLDEVHEGVLANEVVAVKNGLLHVPDRRLHAHSPAFWSHHALPFDFDPAAPKPERWLAFLHELWGDDESSISVLQESIGYLIGGDTRQQKIFLLVGPKRSGKGTIGRVLTGLLGKHNVAAPTLAGMATNFGLSPLIGRPLALISDARLSTKGDASIVVERLLSVSGEDSITVDRKYRDPWTGRLPSRFLVLTNELPRLADSSGALSSRFVLLVLTKSFYGREDPTLTDQLLGEATGILNWALDGLDRLNQRGYFVQPASGAEALRQLEDLASPVAAFIRDRCHVDVAASVGVDDLWAAWRTWCEEDNRHPGTKAVFGRDLRAAVPTLRRERHRSDGRQYTYGGIGLGGDINGPDLGTLGTGDRSEPNPDHGIAPGVPSVPRDSPMYSHHEDEPLATTEWCRDFSAHQSFHKQIASGIWWCDECRIGVEVPV